MYVLYIYSYILYITKVLSRVRDGIHSSKVYIRFYYLFSGKKW